MIYFRGPDFDICQAMDGDHQFFSIYLGSAPDFHQVINHFIGKAKVGNFDGNWYSKDTDDYFSQIAKETLIDISHSPEDLKIEHFVGRLEFEPPPPPKRAPFAHIWINDLNSADLKKAEFILERIEFKGSRELTCTSFLFSTCIYQNSFPELLKLEYLLHPITAM